MPKTCGVCGVTGARCTTGTTVPRPKPVVSLVSLVPAAPLAPLFPHVLAIRDMPFGQARRDVSAEVPGIGWRLPRWPRRLRPGPGAHDRW